MAKAPPDGTEGAPKKRYKFRGLIPVEPVMQLLTRSHAVLRPWEIRPKGTSGWLILIAFILLILVLVVGGVAALLVMPKWQAVARKTVSEAAAEVAAKLDPTPPGAQPSVAPPVATPPPAPARPPSKAPAVEERPSTKEPRGAKKHRNAGGREVGAAMEKLSVEDIVATVKTNAGKLAPCMESARNRGELTPGSYKLLLDWTVRPNGGVGEVALVGPSQLVGSTLALCVTGSIRGWQFPASASGAPVKNYPIGPIVVR
jgi:hypothetical protein